MIRLQIVHYKFPRNKTCQGTKRPSDKTSHGQNVPRYKTSQGTNMCGLIPNPKGYRTYVITGTFLFQYGQDKRMSKPNLPKIGITLSKIECTDKDLYLTYVAYFLTHLVLMCFENLAIIERRFVRGTFCPWDVLSVGRFDRGTFCT